MTDDIWPALGSKNVTRRGFIGVTGAAATAAAGVGSAPVRATGSLTAAQRAVVLRLARTVAVFPLPFPNLGEPGTALSRATPVRLMAAERRWSPVRLAHVSAGAEILIAGGGLGVDQTAMLDNLGRRSAEPANHRSLAAAAGLAVATICSPCARTAESVGHAWIQSLRLLHGRGELLQTARRRGLR